MSKIKDKFYNVIDNAVPVNQWKTMTAKEKKHYCISTLIILLLTAAVICYMIYEPQLTELIKKAAEGVKNTFLIGLLNAIPAILNSILVICFILLSIRIVGIIFNFINPKSQKRKTAIKLIHSAIKYTLCIVMFFLVLKVWGVNTTALIASAGILTVFIGLCVKSIADDLASGVFLVFEGNIEVGDIVTVSDFKGTIREIGLRVTKIENKNNDIIVIRNSDFKNYINNSKNTSYVVVKFALPNKFTKKEIETTVKEVIAKIKVKQKDIKGDIRFLGVQELSTSNTTYGIGFEVFEKRSIQTQTLVYDLLKEAFDEKGYYK